MARIRTIKPQFFKNEDIAELSAMTRLLFIGLWTQADRDGRLEDRPKRLKAEIFPYENYDVDKGLNELQSAGFIIRYKVNVNASGRVLAPEQPETELALIQIKTFSIHQRFTGKEAAEDSLYPPPGSNGEATGKQLGSNGETLGNDNRVGGRKSSVNEPPQRGEVMGKHWEATGKQLGTQEGNKERNGVDGMEARSTPSPAFGSSVLKDVGALLSDCLSDKTYFVDHVRKRFKVSELQIERALHAFNAHLLSIGEGVKGVKDYRAHFQNWLGKQDLKTFRIQPGEVRGSVSETLKGYGV